MSTAQIGSSQDLETAIKLLHEMIPNIDAGDDYLTIVEAEEQIKSSAAFKKKELEEVHAEMKAHARILDAARTSATRPPSVPSASQHTFSLNELDAKRLSLAKAINDIQSSQSAKEAELSRLKEKMRDLEESDPAAEHERELNATPLRIQVFKGMGFEPILDKDGNVVKMLVRAESGDVHCVESNGRKEDFDDIAQLWKTSVS